MGFGWSRSKIAHWLQIGRLLPRYPGVYAWGRADLPEQGELAAGLLFAGRGAGLGGLSALWWKGFLDHRPELIHVDAPGHSRSRQDLVIHHPARMTRDWHRDLPLAPLPRALLTAAADLTHYTLRLVLARAEFNRSLSLPALQAEMGRGVAGSTALRAAMDAHLPQLAKCANDFERDFVLLCERFALPIPEPNERIGRFRPDMLWERRKLIVELDGRDAHRTPAQLIRDGKRQEWLEARGYTVIRFSWAEVQLAAEAVAAKLRPHLHA